MLELKNIHKSFGKRLVLSDVNLKTEKGYVYTLMGANGTGKTTLFNILTGFIKTDSGTIFYNNLKIENLSPTSINHLGITRTFQNLRLIRQLTVRENILLAFKKIKGESIKYAFLPRSFLNSNIYFKIMADDIISRITLNDVADTKAGEISYGQQKLLTLGCCLANDPDVLLLDEPVSGINTVHMQKIIDLINVIKTKGKTVLLIEHNSAFIQAVSDKIFFLNNGKIQTFETYQQLKEDTTVQDAYL
jgi:branched-chain amino acid transport system ATP-binding protein